MIGQDLVRNHVARREPPDDARAGHGGPSHGAAAVAPARQRHEGARTVGGARLPEVPGREHEQLVQVRDEGRVAVHLDAEVFEAGDAPGAGDAARGRAHQRLGHAALRAVRGHGQVLEVRRDLGEAVGVRGEPVARHQALLHDHADQRREQEGVAAGLHLQVDVGDLGGLAAARVDHDQRALRIARDLLQGDARTRDAVREPRVLAQEKCHFAVLEVAAREAAEHAVLDPELARLLLRERARQVARAEHGARGASVRARQVIPLSAAAVIEDRLTAVRVAHAGEARGHLAYRGVPVDLLERAVGAAPQRLRQPLRTVLVEVEARGLLARVALRDRVRVVAAHPDEAAPVGTAELHLDPAIALAQDAGGRLPIGRRSRGHLGSPRAGGGRPRARCHAEGARLSQFGCVMQLLLR